MRLHCWARHLAQRNLEKFLHQQARVIYQQIVLTRKRNASYGGVYVRKLPGIETNRYLYEVGPGPSETSRAKGTGRNRMVTHIQGEP